MLGRVLRVLPPSLKSRLKWALTIPDMEASLTNMARLGFRPAHVLDIGAYVGDWTRMCKRVFPEAQVRMFEPQPERAAGLQALCAELKGVSLCADLLGRAPATAVPFRLLETGSSIYATSRHPQARTIDLKMTTLQLATLGTPFAKPDLLKIDVQGAELDVFAGGWDVVEAAGAIVIEVALFAEYEQAPLMPEIVKVLEARGFRPYDICTIWRNSPSRAADQADMIFLRANSPLFDARNYV